MNRTKPIYTKEEWCGAHVLFLTSMIRKGVGSNETGMVVRDTPLASLEGTAS